MAESHRWNPGESSRLWGRRLKRQGGRKCWDGSEVLQVVDGWRNTDATKWQHWRPGRSSPTGTVAIWRPFRHQWTNTASLKNTWHSFAEPHFQSYSRSCYQQQIHHIRFIKLLNPLQKWYTEVGLCHRLNKIEEQLQSVILNCWEVTDSAWL